MLLRSARTGQQNQFEMACQIIAMMLNVPVKLFKPEEGGRPAVFYRDIEMVSEADVVLCVFSADNPMEGGTAHVVEKAQDRRVPVYAYTDESGTWTRLGEWDPDDSWATRVPAG